MAEETLPKDVKAQARYQQMESDRQGVLTRARECALLTIPAAMPPQGFSPTSKLPTPFQSLGARGVRTLASKFLLSLFPGIPFFNYAMDDATTEKAGAAKGDMDIALSKRERAVVHELETSVFRPAAFQAILQLLIAGNAGMYIPRKQEDRARTFRLDQYVTRRDASGKLMEFVIEEKTDFTALPLAIQAQLLTLAKFKDGKKVDLMEKPVELYTHGYWDHTVGSWTVYQECSGVRLAGTDGTFKEPELPYLFLRFSAQPGEHYGRSYVDEYLGDLDCLEALSETLVEGSAASARVVFMVNPGGVTSLKVVQNAKNGDVVSGNAEDVSCMQVQKQADLQVAKAQAEEIATRLSYAFLLHSSIQRSGERVTAEEIRYMASELDDALGGVYTLLSADFQLPLVRLLEVRMEKRLGAPKVDEKMGIRPVIVTGLEAIGRGHNQANLRGFVKEIIATLTPELALKYINPTELIARTAASYSIETDGLLKSAEQIAQEEQQQQMMALAAQLGPQGINAVGGMAKEAMKQPAAPTE
jgi:hypothetical protein